MYCEHNIVITNIAMHCIANIVFKFKCSIPSKYAAIHANLWKPKETYLMNQQTFVWKATENGFVHSWL